MKKIIFGFSGLVILTFFILIAVNAQNKDQEVEKAQSEVSKDCSHSTSACEPAKCASMECDHAKCEEGKCDPAKCASMECDHTKCVSMECDPAKCEEGKHDPAKCDHQEVAKK
jgi:hypothetical protein